MNNSWVHRNADGYEEWELVIPGECLYILTPATSRSGQRVNVNGKWVEDVTWFLDFSKMDQGQLESTRIATTRDMSDEEARAWALSVA